MKRSFILALGILTLLGSTAFAAEKQSFSKDAVKEKVEEKVEAKVEQKTLTMPPPKESKAVKETVKQAAAMPAASSAEEPEALKKFKSIQNQEQWVAKIEKQLAGEKNQLSEMRMSFASSFGLDAKKLEKGEYTFDPKSGKFVARQ